MVEIYDVNGQRIKCELLFTFEKNNKSFIVYKDKEDEILASYFERIDDKIVITSIDDENDYDLVDIELEKWWNQNE